jgi:flavin reductase (DIM6/NTAB) family NADH-FMN oxidoreductase RutF/DNA-binding IclR family transcriptional regulator
MARMAATVPSPSDPKWFRQVLGQYPTGVCVITARPPDGPPAGLAVGSFTSVSLDPPMVAFLPDKGSSSWPKIERAGCFCVNILSAEQEDVCRRFAMKVEDKFEGLPHRPAASGSPIIDDVVAWIDCDIESVHDAGDHYIVLGLVRELQIESPSLPLLFFQGGYGRFAPLSLAAPNSLGALTEQLRHVDLVRPEMERLAEDLLGRCIASARVDDELVVVAAAGATGRGSVTTLVGQRLPFVPTTGSTFAAWSSDQEIDRWLSANAAAETHADHRERLEVVRKRGYSVGLLNEAQRMFASTLDRLAADPSAAASLNLRDLIDQLAYDPVDLSPDVQKDIRILSAPVFGRGGDVALVFSFYDFPKPAEDAGIQGYINRVLEAARRATERLGGNVPSPPRIAA